MAIAHSRLQDHEEAKDEDNEAVRTACQMPLETRESQSCLASLEVPPTRDLETHRLVA